MIFENKGLIMKFVQIVLVSLVFFFLAGCSTPVVAPVKVEITNAKIDYLKDVKPILDKRCVSCHSCYNSPCQAKMSSFEGVDRGASKLLVYDATRFKAVEPTRLFIDEKSTDGWRQRDFYSLTSSPDSNATHNDSIMLHLLYDKKKNPDIIGSYQPEADELICPRNQEELDEYIDEKENHGMPYGFPALKQSEYQTLSEWIHRGAKGPTKAEQKKLITPSKKAQTEIKKWEAFLNQDDAKHSLTSRYLYEHLFLAHITFNADGGEYFRLVRSYSNAPSSPDEIPTVRPFDDPKVKKFYYRFIKIHSTIVHKTHMVLVFNDEKLARFKELFIKPKWTEKPHYIDYEVKMSANPFVAFVQIPAKSRYQFLLDNSQYIVMTFIRGPVCRGQMALNVIHDHFWLMFLDPEYDLTLSNPQFIATQAENLSMPIEMSNQSVWETFSDSYREKYETYFERKQELYDSIYPKGLGVESIWKGNKASDTPLLTIYRHFDSASVHKGVIGELPRTMWVIDYPQLERIYYSLVAGYDVYGNVSHQTNIRRYMDFLRMEGEINFISYMPYGGRLNLFKSWYIGDDDIQDIENVDGKELMKRDTKVRYKTKNYKQEFIENVVDNRILKSTDIHFETVNYYRNGEKNALMPKEFNSFEDIKMGAKSLTLPGTAFIEYVTDNDVNVILVRVKMNDGTSHVRSIVINRWHDNVNSLFSSEQVSPQKDTMDWVVGSVGSYPNMFAVVEENDVADFFDVIENFDESDEYRAKIVKYMIGRDSKDFWKTFDWFMQNFYETDPLNAGLYDLNRYYRYGWGYYGYKGY